MAQEIDKREISRTEADRILQIEESHYIDLKAVEADPAGLSEAVSAFANTAGGELFIGIDEKAVNGKKKRKWRGFKDIEAANDRIARSKESLPWEIIIGPCSWPAKTNRVCFCTLPFSNRKTF